MTTTTTDDWFSELDKADPKNPPMPCGWRVLIRPDAPLAKVGNILIPIDKVEKDKMVVNTGRILAIGPLAWDKPEMLGQPWAKVGDSVLFGKYAGIKLESEGVSGT